MTDKPMLLLSQWGFDTVLTLIWIDVHRKHVKYFFSMVLRYKTRSLYSEVSLPSLTSPLSYVAPRQLPWPLSSPLQLVTCCLACCGHFLFKTSFIISMLSRRSNLTFMFFLATTGSTAFLLPSNEKFKSKFARGVWPPPRQERTVASPPEAP